MGLICQAPSYPPFHLFPLKIIRYIFLLSEKGRLSKYLSEYVEELMGEPCGNPLGKTVASTLLGSEKFIAWVQGKWAEKRASHRDIPALRKLSSWPDLSSILKESERVFGKRAVISRRVALYLSHRFSGLPLGEIGGFLGG
jgi:hypothetical protein